MQREGRRILPTKAKVLGACAVFSCPMQGNGETEFLVQARLLPADGRKSRREIELHLGLHEGDESDGEWLVGIDIVANQMRDAVGRNVHLLGHPSSLIINQTVGFRCQEQNQGSSVGRVRTRSVSHRAALVDGVAYVLEAVAATECLHYELLHGRKWPETVIICERRVEDEDAEALERARLKFRPTPCLPGAFTHRVRRPELA